FSSNKTSFGILFGYKNEDWYFACTKEVRLEPKVAIEVVKIDGLKLAEIEYVHINNYDVVKAAVMQNGKALKYASKELKDNPELKALAKEQIANAKAKKKAEKKSEKIESISVNL
ncbi:MAG: DUF4116 domain-containing protein, partial [Clostridia bacterium]|nr:DUF4116 domain-containing protein [Clostridia bacterium]